MPVYHIKSLFYKLEDSQCPPAFLPVVFPNFNGEQTRFIFDERGNVVCEVTFETEQTPTDLGPLIKVERVDIPS